MNTFTTLGDWADTEEKEVEGVRMLVIREIIFIAVLSVLSKERAEQNSPSSEDCIFIEKSLTGWLKAIVISNCEDMKQ